MCSRQPSTGNWPLFASALILAGCGAARTQPTPPPSAPAEEIVTLFDPSTAGSIRGRVTWNGAVPVVSPFEIRVNPDSNPVLREQRYRANPNAPVIDPTTRAVEGAVVFLRGVDSQRARPWDLPPVRVEIRDRGLHVVQGVTDAKVGFVRRGDRLEMVSREADCHSLHAGGITFFTLTFPDPNQPLSRNLNDKGIVELSSHAGFFWMRAYVFVTDHPYFARTDAQGRFELPRVPPGEYEVVCWMPNWNVADYDRDPETSFLSRIRFAAPTETVKKVSLSAKEDRAANLEISDSAFGKPPK